MTERVWAWVPTGTEISSRTGVTVARKNHRVKVYRIFDVDHDHPVSQTCNRSCVPGSSARVAWVDGGARWCEAKLDFIDEHDPRWYRESDRERR